VFVIAEETEDELADFQAWFSYLSQNLKVCFVSFFGSWGLYFKYHRAILILCLIFIRQILKKLPMEREVGVVI
jgi:AAA+ ATPase superfamily predicted ATPase